MLAGAVPEEVLRSVRRIEIRTRRLVQDSMAGEYHSVFRGSTTSSSDSCGSGTACSSAAFAATASRTRGNSRSAHRV